MKARNPSAVSALKVMVQLSSGEKKGVREQFWGE